MKKITKIFASFAFVLAFCFLAIGYAAVQDTLLVSGNVSIEAQNKVFAVYGEAFDSNGESIGKALNFYNRPAVKASDTIQLLNDDGTMTYGTQKVEAIYENIDTAVYTSRDDVPWNEYNNDVNTAIKTMRVVDEGIAPVSTAYWFAQKSTVTTDVNELHTIDVAKLDTSNVTTMKSMFYCCKNVKEIDLSNFNTSKVESMESMFYNCFGLTELNFSSFDTSNVTNMKEMFRSCNHLTSLNVNHFNTSKVTNMSSLFRNCQQLTELDLSNFNTEQVTYMDSMFTSCANLQILDLSGFDTRNVIDMGQMFHCPALERIYISENWTTESVRTMTGYGSMFGSSELVGGAGSTTSNAGSGLSAARIDGGPSAPGLFTYKHYEIIFDGNHDNASDVPKMILSEVNTFTLPQPPKHPWATFLGWATTADATAPEYTGETFTSSTAAPCCDVLYAVWGNLGATSMEELQETVVGDGSTGPGSSAEEPLIIGGGDWTIFGTWSAGESVINGKHLVMYDGRFVDNTGIFLWTHDAVITIEGGYFEAQYLAVFPSNLTLNIKGGVFKISDELFMADGFSGAINIIGGIFSKDPRTYSGAVIPSECTVVENADGTWSVVAPTD